MPEGGVAMKLNQRGFSLVELLVIVAIMSILAGVGLQSFGLVQTGRVKDSANTLITQMQETQKNAKNIYCDYYWQLVISNEDGKYTVTTFRVNEKTVSGVKVEDPQEYNSQKLNGKLDVEYTCGDSKINADIREGYELVITFEKGSGKVIKVEDNKSDGTFDTVVYETSMAVDESKENINIKVKSANSNAKKGIDLYFLT